MNLRPLHLTILCLANLGLCSACLTAQTTRAPNLFYEFFLTQDPSEFGASVEFTRDYVVVGRPDEDRERGAVYLHDPTSGRRVARIASDLRPGDRFGHSLAVTRDLLIVGAPQDGFGSSQPGFVRIYDHAGKFLAERKSPVRLASFGFAVSGVGDVTGDGVEEFAVGAPRGRPQGRNGVGFVDLFDGRSRSFLLRVVSENEARSRAFGYAIDGGLDVNGDRLPDLIVGDPRHGGAPPAVNEEHGIVELFSILKTGGQYRQVSFQAHPGAKDVRRGHAVALLGDLRHPATIGRSDYAFSDFNRIGQSIVEVVGFVPTSNGGRRQPIRSHRGPTNVAIGRAIKKVGKVDTKDDTPDYVISSYRRVGVGSGNGALFAYSGQTGSLIFDFQNGPGNTGGPTGSAFAARDLDGDGIVELLVGSAARYENSPVQQAGSAMLLNTRKLALQVRDRHVVDVSSRDVRDLQQNIRVDAAYARSGILRHDHAGLSQQPWADDNFGRSVEGIGDLDGDGHEEYAVGATGAGQGAVEIYAGVDGRRIARLDNRVVPGNRFGNAMCLVGDLDRDGRRDLLVYSSGDPGRGCLSLFSGKTLALLGWYAEPRTSQVSIGLAFEGVGDWDGDKVPDVAVGMATTSGTGQLAIFSGAHLLTGRRKDLISPIGGPQPNGRFGWSLAVLGDWGTDGKPEIVVAAPFTGGGQVVVVDAAANRTVLTVNGSGTSQLGYVVGRAGDVDRDGKQDFFVTAPADSSKDKNAGSISIYGSATGKPRWTRFGARSDALGTAASLVGDTTGDGRPEIAVSGRNLTGHTGRGYVRVLTGTGDTIAEVTGSQDGDRFGISVAGVDVTSGGLADVLIGAEDHDVRLGNQDRLRVGRAAVFTVHVAQPGSAFVILGSLTPQWQVLRGGLVLPGVIDGYSFLRAFHPPGGILDQSGIANINVNLALLANRVEFRGLTLYHFAAFLNSSGIADFSNIVPLSIW